MNLRPISNQKRDRPRFLVYVILTSCLCAFAIPILGLRNDILFSTMLGIHWLLKEITMKAIFGAVAGGILGGIAWLLDYIRRYYIPIEKHPILKKVMHKFSQPIFMVIKFMVKGFVWLRSKSMRHRITAIIFHLVMSMIFGALFGVLIGAGFGIIAVPAIMVNDYISDKPLDINNYIETVRFITVIVAVSGFFHALSQPGKLKIDKIKETDVIVAKEEIRKLPPTSH